MIATLENFENRTLRDENKNSGKKRQYADLGKSATCDMRYIHHPSFCLPGTEERLWGPCGEIVPIFRYNLLPEIDQADTTVRHKQNVLTQKQGKTLFLRYNYAKYRLVKILKRRANSRTAETLSQETLWKDRAEAARDQIVHANLPLVLSMAKRYAPWGVELADLVSEGNMALLRAVECFDVSRGFNFSTYACRAILACFHRMGTRLRNYRKHIPVNYDPELQESDEIDRRHDQQLDMAMANIREAVFRNYAKLTDIELAILLGRFPIHSHGPSFTLTQIGKRLGLSSERVRQIEGSCILKLRDAMEKHPAA